MPLQSLQGLNESTTTLLNLVYNNPHELETIKNLLEASSIHEKRDATKHLTLTWQNNFYIEDGSTLIQATSCLDVAIIKKRKTYFDLLLNYIFEKALLSHQQKEMIFISAASFACIFKCPSYLNSLLRYRGFNLNQALPGPHQGISLVLHHAINVGEMKTISSLLFYGADPDHTEKPSKFSKITPTKKAFDFAHGIHKNEIISLLKCTVSLQKARASINPATAHRFLAKAIGENIEFVFSYLQYYTHLAISQLTFHQDKTDYRFLKKFIQRFAKICSEEDYLPIYKQFQLDIVQLLLGAYNLDEAVPPDIYKLFNSAQEKMAFFKNPLVDHLLAGTQCEQTVSSMKESALLNDVSNKRSDSPSISKSNIFTSITKEPLRGKEIETRPPSPIH